MALPASGQISMSQVNVELGLSATATISLNDSAVRTLFGISSGTISLNDGHGKANAFAGTISTNQQELNLRTWALANGWNGTSAATITVGSGVYIWSDNTATPGLTIDGSWPGGITLVNNGFIMGKGGDGRTFYKDPGLPGGNAISLGCNCVINNIGYIGGGGGAGGGCQPFATGSGGGGAGGGTGGGGVGYGGAGGAVGMSGGNGSGYGGGAGGGGGNGGGGGGRIFPGVGGAPAPGSGAGAGGSGNNTGGAGVGYSAAGGGGGGWGAYGGPGQSSAGGAGGKAVARNGFSVTWLSSTSNVYGSIS